MIRFLRVLGNRALDRLAGIGRATLVFASAIGRVPRLADVPLIVKQIYQVGVLSLVIIVLSAFCIGAVLALQFHTQLAKFGAQDAVGVGLALVVTSVRGARGQL